MDGLSANPISNLCIALWGTALHLCLQPRHSSALLSDATLFNFALLAATALFYTLVRCNTVQTYPACSYGTLLMEEAERIARFEHRSKKLAVISGVGTRHYYRYGPVLTSVLLKHI